MIFHTIFHTRIKESQLPSLSPSPLFPHGCEEHWQLGLYNVCSKAELQLRQGFMVKSKSSEKNVYIHISTYFFWWIYLSLVMYVKYHSTANAFSTNMQELKNILNWYTFDSSLNLDAINPCIKIDDINVAIMLFKHVKLG